MKKTSLFLGMVLAASMAMAQNTSNTKQLGEDNQISVEQTGTNNLVGRTSTGPTGGDAVTYSSQTGDDNHATVTQDGDGNKAMFEQGVSDRYSTLPQGGATQGDDNSITISQTGNNNSTWGPSLGNANIVSVTQATGGDVVQTDGPNQAGLWLWGNGNHATMSQTGGTGNYAYTAANTSSNTATINQIGFANEGYTTQGWSGAGNAWMTGNTATINQTGNRNKVILADGPEFSPALPGYTSDLWGFGIIQDGANNTGSVTQDGDDNQAAIFQAGSTNGGTIIQSTDWNEANLIQLGDGNSASITQEVGNSNVVNLKQDGNDGEATILQKGTGNVVKGLGLVDMATSFDGSSLDVTQIGTTNMLHLQQTNGASATVSQNGTSNVATVSQN